MFRPYWSLDPCNWAPLGLRTRGRVVAVPEAAGCFSSGFFLFDRASIAARVRTTRRGIAACAATATRQGRVKADQTYVNTVLSDTMESASRSSAASTGRVRAKVEGARARWSGTWR